MRSDGSITQLRPAKVEALPADGSAPEARLWPQRGLARRLRFASTSTGPLTRNSRHRFAADHALRLYRQGAVATFIPKNACSTLRYSLALANGCISGPDDIDWIHKNNKTFCADLADLATADYTFAILRCPYRRIVSMFLDKVAGGKGGPSRIDRLMIPGWRRLIGAGQSARDKVTFRSFLTRLGEGDALNADPHWCPQNSFLVYEEYDDLFCVENLAEASTRLAQKIGFELMDARALTRHGAERAERVRTGHYADIPVRDLRLMRERGAVPDYATFYDDQTRAMVAKLYAADIDLYRETFGAGTLLVS